MNAIAQSLTRPPIEPGDPAQDPKAFRRCLGQYPTGVTIITACHAGQKLGMAVNSFAAVSLAPPLVLWSIRRESRSAQAFLNAGHFAVSILAEDQVDVSQAFGAGAPDRFEKVAWRPGLEGAPLIEGAIAHLECRTEIVHDGGDHHILIGRVISQARFEGTPLVFAQGQYAVTQNHPNLAAPGSEPVPAAASSQEQSPHFLRLLGSASQRTSQAFQVHRDALDLTTAMARILSVLYEGARTCDELEHLTYLGRLNLEDGLSSLEGRGLLVRTLGGRHELTATGRERCEALAQRAERFARERLEGLSAADIEATQRVLGALRQR